MIHTSVANDINKLRELLSELVDFIRSFLPDNYYFNILFIIVRKLSILKQFKCCNVVFEIPRAIIP
jgi:hypothetical protein